jgi:excisionase family DNA binding protein
MTSPGEWEVVKGGEPGAGWEPFSVDCGEIWWRRRKVGGVSPMVGVEAVCEILGVSSETLRRWRNNGTFPRPAKCGKKLRWQRDDVMAWIQDRRN